MKGIITQHGKEKSIVLFNNGKIGEIPTPANSEEGTIITVSYNKKIIAFLGIFSCIVLICIIALLVTYNRPLGFVQINYGNASVELTYNRFQRVIAARPLNTQAVQPLTILSLNNVRIKTAYERIILAFIQSDGGAATQPSVIVRIAQDNLVKAKKIEQSLSLLDKELAVVFQLYTHELYEAMLSQPSQPLIERPSPNRGRQQMRGGWGRRPGYGNHH